MLRSDLLVSMMVWRSAGILTLFRSLMNTEIVAMRYAIEEEFGGRKGERKENAGGKEDRDASETADNVQAAQAATFGGQCLCSGAIAPPNTRTGTRVQYQGSLLTKTAG